MCISWLSMCVCVCCVKSVRRHKCDTTDWVARAPLTYIYTIHNSIYRRWFINYSTSTTIFVSFTSHRNIFDEAIKQHAVCSVVRFWELPFFFVTLQTSFVYCILCRKIMITRVQLNSKHQIYYAFIHLFGIALMRLSCCDDLYLCSVLRRAAIKCKFRKCREHP